MPEPLKHHSIKFLGGSINLIPAKSFQGKTGQVDLPDRIVLKLEGQQITLTAVSCEAIANLVGSENQGVQTFLSTLKEAELNGQEY